MPRRHQLQKLLQTSVIWKANEVTQQRHPLPTGFPELDQVLGGGWPRGVLVELLVTPYGIGELRLLLPGFRALDEQRRILLVAPPYVPYAPAFARHGLDLAQLLVVSPRRSADAWWAVEQALRSGSCAAVVAWLDSGDDRMLRRLQLAVERDDCWVVLFRPPRFRRQRSAAALRLRLTPDSGSGLRIQVLKQRGGRPKNCRLVLPAD